MELSLALTAEDAKDDTSVFNQLTFPSVPGDGAQLERDVVPMAAWGHAPKDHGGPLPGKGGLLQSDA